MIDSEKEVRRKLREIRRKKKNMLTWRRKVYPLIVRRGAYAYEYLNAEIPSGFIEALGLKSGDKIEFTITDNGEGSVKIVGDNDEQETRGLRRSE